MAKANKEELYTLHKMIAEYYMEALESGEDLSSGTLAAINTFLKNNDIKMDVVEESPAQNLTFKLQQLIQASEEAS
jgi:ABC-type Zn uptake system ZnuABC Zn-binding protein ZnuA